MRDLSGLEGVMPSETFMVVSSGRDEYPGTGLRLKSADGRVHDMDPIERIMDWSLREGDEVEVEVRVVSRVVVERRRVVDGEGDR